MERELSGVGVRIGFVYRCVLGIWRESLERRWCLIDIWKSERMDFFEYLVGEFWWVGLGSF